jgi:hypothetical protein
MLASRNSWLVGLNEGWASLGLLREIGVSVLQAKHRNNDRHAACVLAVTFRDSLAEELGG